MTQPDFILIPTVVLTDKRLNALDGKVFGYIYWLTKLKNERCTASNGTLATLANTTVNTIQHCLTRLELCGYVTRVYHVTNEGIEKIHNNNRKIRLEILCNVQFSHNVLPASNRVLPTDNRGVLPTDNQNKSSPIKRAVKERGTALIAPDSYIEAFKEKYPGKNVETELSKAYSWLQASGKTYKNYQQFYNYWLLKADNAPKQGGVHVIS